MSIVTPEWVKNAVFYQIFPDRFARSSRLEHPRGISFKPWGSPPHEQGFQGGDLLGIVDKLDYLQELGVSSVTQVAFWVGLISSMQPVCMAITAPLWGILSGGVVTDVTVPTHAGHRRRDGLVVHRSPVSAHNVTVRRGIPVTTLLQTVLDVAAVVRVRRLHQVFEEAQVQHRLQPEVVAAEALCRRGFRGNARVWHTLEGSVDPSGVRSVLELRFLRMCAAQALPRPVVNERIGPWTPDFLWPEARLAVETDGDRFHRTAAKRARDAEKDAFMRGQGLEVFRLSWADVTQAPDVTGARIAELLRSAR